MAELDWLIGPIPPTGPIIGALSLVRIPTASLTSFCNPQKYNIKNCKVNLTYADSCLCHPERPPDVVEVVEPHRHQHRDALVLVHRGKFCSNDR